MASLTEPNRCPQCGHPASAEARFCEACGGALRPGPEGLRPPEPLAAKIRAQRSAIEGERKQVTVMFTDIVRSMELARALEAERWGELLERFVALGSEAIHAVEGTVNQFTGDGLMALFGAPLAHEDHARRACLAALELERRIVPLAAELARSDGVELKLRTGLNSGQVVVGQIGEELDIEFAAIGNTTAIAKRIEALAPEGRTALSASTAALVEGQFALRELGAFELKGMAERQRAFELAGPGAARDRLEAAAAHGLTRFVGRGAELAMLEGALERALAGEGRVVGLVGDPGVGKSRLCREFVTHCRERGLMVNTASALAHGRAMPLLPVLAMLRDYLGVGEADEPATARARIEAALLPLDPGLEPELPLIFDFLGVSDPARPAERIDPEARQRRLLAFVGRLLRARSRRRAAVTVLEDLHWIDDASAVFLDALAEAVPGTRTLVLALFRPEYEAEWMRRAPHELLPLDALDDPHAAELLDELLGPDPSLDPLKELIGARAEGNPFFTEEIVRALAEEGRLVGERGAYRLAAPAPELVLPATVQAVLGARIDRLPGREKALLQTLAVVGQEAPEPLLGEVAELGGRELGASLAALEAAELLTEARANGHRELAFRHPLTQEVAYASQLSGARARAHAAVAAAIERLYPDRLDERAALVAHHREAAGETLEAARWHARAAVWAAASSPPEGMRHWRRARELADSLPDSEEVAGLAVGSRIGILSLSWRVGMPDEDAQAAHAEGLERLEPGSSFQRVLLDLAYGGHVFLSGREVEGVKFEDAALDGAFELGDPGLILTVAWPVAVNRSIMGPLAEGFEVTDRALALAGDDHSAGAGLVFGCPYAECLSARGQCAGLMGRLERAWEDFDRAIELAREHGDLAAELHAVTGREGLRVLILDFEAGFADAERSVELAEQAGTAQDLVMAYAILASLRAQAGDFRGALATATSGLEIAQRRRMFLSFEPLMWRSLARARLGLGQPDQAPAAAQKAVTIMEARSLHRFGPPVLVTLARVLMAIEGVDAGDLIEGHLERALALSRKTGDLLNPPHVYVTLADLARLRGDEETAEREEAEAERILNQIGAPSMTLEALREEFRSPGDRASRRIPGNTHSRRG